MKLFDGMSTFMTDVINFANHVEILMYILLLVNVLIFCGVIVLLWKQFRKS